MTLPWDEALEAVHKAVASDGDLLFACHVSPDGDALGSMLAAALAVSRRAADTGRRPRIRCSWGDRPFGVPAAYGWLPGLELCVAPDQVADAPDVMLTFDTGSVDRLGELGDWISAAGQTVVVDHHASNTLFGTVNLVDPTAAATAVLVAELAGRLGVALDAQLAAGLYTGLITDTGLFRYAATTPSVHILAARLLETGIRHDLIARAIYDTKPFGYVRLLAAALGRAALEPAAAGGLGLIWTHTTVGDLDEAGVELEDIEAVIDEIRVTAEAEVAVVCKQDRTGALRVSTRSKGRIDVGAVCVALGGGGHRFAAGYTSEAGLAETVAVLRAALADAPQLPG